MSQKKFETHTFFYGNSFNATLNEPYRKAFILNVARWFEQNHRIILATEHSDYSQWKKTTPNYGAAFDLIEALRPNYLGKGSTVKTAKEFIPLLESYAKYPDQQNKPLTKLLKEISSSWSDYLVSLKREVATWLSDNHLLILCVGHPHYIKFRDSLKDKYGDVLEFLEVIRYPYENHDDHLPATSNIESFVEMIDSLEVKWDVALFSHDFMRLLKKTNQKWELFELEQAGRNPIDALTLQAMAGPLASAAAAAAAANLAGREPPTKRLRFKYFTKPQENLEQEYQSTGDSELNLSATASF